MVQYLPCSSNEVIAVFYSTTWVSGWQPGKKKKRVCLLCCTGAIKRKVELDWGTEDMEYLQKVELHVEGALNEVLPDIIIYNAGTDILDGDPLGGLAISPQV